MVGPGVSHDFAEEDLEAKARWFARFTPEERLRMLIDWADTMLALNPDIEEVGRACPNVRAQLPDVFKSLNAHEVRYVVIGGVAAIVHGVPRTTFDVGLLIEASEGNAGRLLAALQEAGVASAALTTPEGLLAHEITVFKDVLRIDVRTRTPGVEFPAAWRDRVERTVDGVRYWIVSRDHLIAAKLAAGRPRDLEDVEVLRRTGLP